MKTNKILRYLSSIIMAMIFLPLLANNLPPYIGSIHLYIMLWFLVIIFSDRSTVCKRYNLYVIIIFTLIQYLFFNTIWSNISLDQYRKHFIEHYAIILSVCLLGYFSLQKNIVDFGKITYRTIIFIMITCFITIYVSFINPLFIRSIIAVNVSNISHSDVLMFKKLGAGTYGFATLLVILLPSLIYLIKENKISRIRGLFLVFIFFFTLIRIQLVTNIIIASILIIFSILGRKDVKKSVIIVLFVFFIAFFIPLSYYSTMIANLANLFDVDSSIFIRLNSISQLFTRTAGNSSYIAEDRLARYPLLFKAWKENIFFGAFSVTDNHYWESGFHLYWMYKLGSFGLFGFILYISVHYIYIKKSLKYFGAAYKFYFILSCVGMHTLGLFKNLAGREAWVGYFVLLHGVYYITKKKSANK